MPGFDHFDFLAPFYDRVIRSKHPDGLLSILELPERGVLLDAGGGTGRVAQWLVGKTGKLIITDLSLKMLKQAQEKRAMVTVNSHSERLPLPANYFDRIIMVDALHHVCNQQETADELWRVLKPGGRIVIEEPDIRFAGVKLIAIGEKLALMRSHFLSPKQIEALFRGSNAVIRTQNDGPIAWIIINKPLGN